MSIKTSFMIFTWSSLNMVQSFFFRLMSELWIFSPQNFSAAGPFKASVSGPSSPPLTLSLENGAASQPIRTPARVKKVKGHHRWSENGKAVDHHQRFVKECWRSVVLFFFFLRPFTPTRGGIGPLFKDVWGRITAQDWDVVSGSHCILEGFHKFMPLSQQQLTKYHKEKDSKARNPPLIMHSFYFNTLEFCMTLNCFGIQYIFFYSLAFNF